MSLITAIELENFQSIERRTRIELRPITLLFGPNSAGKSSIFDAIDLLQVLLDPTKFEQSIAENMVDRWARRGTNKSYRETFIAVEFLYDGQDIHTVWANDSNWVGSSIRTEYPIAYLSEDDVEYYQAVGKTIRIELSLKVIDEDSPKQFFLTRASCSLMGHLQLLLEHDASTQFEPEDDESLKNSPNYERIVQWCDYRRRIAEQEPLGLRSLRLAAASEPLSFTTVSPALTDSNPQSFTPFKSKDIAGRKELRLDVISGSLSPLMIRDSTIYANKEQQYVASAVIRNATEIFFFYGTLLFSDWRTYFGAVKPDRRSPRPEEALTVVDLGIRGWWRSDSMSSGSPAQLLKQYAEHVDEHYKGMALAAHADLLLQGKEKQLWLDFSNEKIKRTLIDKSQIVSRINNHLERNLFTEKLYRVACSSTIMVPLDLEESDPSGLYALAQPAAVRLYLIDGDKNKVELQDVGSGVPFVLPVLYAAVHDGIVRIQQPELHLHPALQSSLADVFIEELHHGEQKQFLLETHSEHFLLRILRRIRHTTNEKALSSDLHLSNDQVSIYYFDPTVDGGTIVSQQLVTPLGDFYNDWPRGFFQERESDLFD